MIQYVVEVLAFQLLFLVVYDLFLKKETFFNWNRVYLIATSLISLLIPFMKFSAITTAIPEQYTYVFPAFENLQEVVVTGEKSFGFNYQFQWEHLLFLGMAISFGFLLFKLYKINVLLRKGKVIQLTNYTKVLLLQSKQAFSFFKYIFLGDAIVDKEHEKIIEHELVHVRQKHSIDLLYFEMLRVIFWFNPLIYVYQNRIAELHEFIADAKAVKTNKEDYVNHLLSQAFQVQHISFVNQFLKPSLLKKRLKMISRQQSKSIFKLKYLFLVPLVLCMLVYNSCEQLENETLLESEGLIVEQIDEDLALKKQMLKEYKSKDLSELSRLRNGDSNFRKSFEGETVLSKEDFYRSRILNTVYMVKSIKDARFKDLIDESDLRPILLKVYSYDRVERISYKGYLNDIAFYKVFDNNIKLSLRGFIKTLSPKDDLKNEEGVLHINVKNTKDFTGDELRTINKALDKVIAKSANVVIVTDGVNTGQFVRDVFFDLSRNSIQTTSNFEKNLEKTPFAVVDQVPIFPGCENATDKRACFQEKIQEHIRKNFKYPPEAQAANIQGRVYNNFVISEDGTIQNLRMRGPNKLLEAEVERIINQLPRFIPGKHKGKVVNVPFSIPVTFKLHSSKASDNSVSRSSEENENTEQYQDKVVPFAVIDKVPVFPGCESDGNKKDCFNEKFNDHVRKYFNYPNDLKAEGIEGNVYIMFEIDKKGKIDVVKTRAPHARLEAAARKIIDKLPIFEPGMHKGKAVRVPYATKITYSL